ncbi:MAG: hypothetical protein Q8P67_06405 [archaeon]|nr:hypothetical protein [archaeon]
MPDVPGGGSPGSGNPEKEGKKSKKSKRDKKVPKMSRSSSTVDTVASPRSRSVTSPVQRASTVVALPILEGKEGHKSKGKEKASKDTTPTAKTAEGGAAAAESSENDFSFGSDSEDENNLPKLSIVIKPKEEAAADSAGLDDLLLDQPTARGNTTARGVRGRARTLVGTASENDPDFTNLFAAPSFQPPSPAAAQDAHLQEAARLMGEFHSRLDAALQHPEQEAAHLSGVLQELSKVAPAPAHHIRYAVAYRTAMLLLHEIQARPDAAPLCSRLLADLPLLPHHRVVAIRVAVAAQVQAKNFGVASRLIHLLRSQMNLPPELEEVLALCKAQEGKNASLPKDAPPEYSDFSRRLRFLSQPPFTIVPHQSAHPACDLCYSIFAESSSNCQICFIGKISS